MDSLKDPANLPIKELSLAANGLTEDMGDLLAKIISMHCENRDSIIWKYALRNEYPPNDKLGGLKKLDLSFNKLG